MVLSKAEPESLVQFHWQNPANPSQTEFVAQGGFADITSFESWCADIIERRGAECPEGWAMMICNQDSEHFVLTPK